MENKVSLWLGNIKDQQTLKDYIDFIYTEDGDSICSRFFLDFNINYDNINEDFIERYVLEKRSSDLNKLLEGCSYYDYIIPKFQKILITPKSYNSVVLIYNFEYNNSLNPFKQFDYIGVVSYNY